MEAEDAKDTMTKGLTFKRYHATFMKYLLNLFVFYAEIN